MNQNDTNATTYAIGQHPSLPPPVTERGILKWLKTNLFNTWYNSIATIIGLYLLYLVIPPTFDWVWGSATWEASSNKDCRAGEGGACWGFIKARFVLFMYGFYEAESLWRPNLAGLLLIFLGIPVLVPKIPGTRVFAIFLIFFYPWLALSLLVGPIKITVVLVFLNWGLGLPEVDTTKFGGLLLTLVLALTSIVVSLPLGILLALGRRAESLPVVMYLCIAFIELFRAVPLITVLFMAVNMIPLFLPQGYSFDNVVMALIALTLFFGAYLAEVVRGGLQAIPKGQFEAASSIGLNYYKSTRLIVLPQALKIVIPGIVNTFIAMTKDTSLVMIIGLFDILMITKSSITDAKWLGLEWEGYAFVGLLFWILCFSMSRYSQWLEKRLDTDRRD